MQPLLRFGAPGPGKCDPYSVLVARALKNATPIAFWSPGDRKMRPLQRFGAPGPGKRNPYNVLGPRGLKNATPIAF